MIKKLKTIISSTATLISVLGIITFTLFIFEESIQIAVFGTWPAQYARDWDLVMKGTDMIETINHQMKMVNYSLGWLQPLAFFSYRAYGKATDYYIKSLRAKVFANCPQCLVGRTVEFVFIPKKIEAHKDRVELVSGELRVFAQSIPQSQSVLVTGTVERQGDTLVIKADSIKPVTR